MKIKETFFWAKLPLCFEKRSSFSLNSSSLNWEVKEGPFEIFLRKRDSCPRTFIFQNKFFLVFGYIESSLYSQLLTSLKEKRSGSDFINSLSSNAQNEFLLIVLDKESKEIKIYRDVFCTLPIFYLIHKNFLFLSNEFINLSDQYQKQEEIKIDIQRLAERLFFRSGYSDSTIFPNLKVLSERSVLTIKEGQVKVKYPLAHAFPQKKKNSLASFTASLEKTLRIFFNRIENFSDLGFEISGGVDSLTPLKFFQSKSSMKMNAFSLLLPAQSGEKQQKKLKTIVRFSPINLHLTSTANNWPLSFQIFNSKLAPFYLGQEIYSESLGQMARQAKKKGIKFIVTGIGGDEAFKIDSREKIGFQGSEEESFRKKFLSPSFFTSFLQKAFQEAIPNPLPLPLVPYSVLSSNLARNNIYIRQNIWPFAPLAHPNFIDFCRSLPISERKNKKILRDYLQQQGYPLSLTCPVDNENFASFFENTMRRSEIKDFFWRLLANSQLEKLGLIKREEVMSCYLKYQKKKNKINPLYFYTIITAEILLQSFD